LAFGVSRLSVDKITETVADGFSWNSRKVCLVVNDELRVFATTQCEIRMQQYFVTTYNTISIICR